MATVLVTGSTTGLGLAAATQLIDEGHEVVLHARDRRRAADVAAVRRRAAGIVTGDLADLDETRGMAAELDVLAPALARLDAVIHNAGIYAEDSPHRTVDGHPRILAVNVLAPYLLTALMRRPARLIYLSSSMHSSGRRSLDDLDWTRRRWNGTQAYCDSKLLVTAFALAIARRWTDTCTNAVDPGWVPTRMGGPDASDDLVLGHTTQTWLATSDDETATTTGGYWYHLQRRQPAPPADDRAFQDELLERLAHLTSAPLPTPDDTGADAG